MTDYEPQSRIDGPFIDHRVRLDYAVPDDGKRRFFNVTKPEMGVMYYPKAGPKLVAVLDNENPGRVTGTFTVEKQEPPK